MKSDEFWTNFTALLPDGVECDFDGDECVVKGFGKECNVVRNDSSFVVDGTALHFEDAESDVVDTLLVPYVLQALDGERRI